MWLVAQPSGRQPRRAQCHFAAEAAYMLALRNRLESGLKAISPHAVIFAEATGQGAVIAFDLEGIGVSSRAVCSSGKVQPSHVLAAMEISPCGRARRVRVSLGWNSTAGDVGKFLGAWTTLATALPKELQGIAA